MSTRKAILLPKDWDKLDTPQRDNWLVEWANMPEGAEVIELTVEIKGSMLRGYAHRFLSDWVPSQNGAHHRE